MTPEQLAALKVELERFQLHPLNEKYNVIYHSFPATKCFVDPEPEGSEGLIEFSEKPYAFRAVLLQRLKDALTAEGWYPFYSLQTTSEFSSFGYRHPSSPWSGGIWLENTSRPEVLRLLRAINQSEVFN